MRLQYTQRKGRSCKQRAAPRSMTVLLCTHPRLESRCISNGEAEAIFIYGLFICQALLRHDDKPFGMGPNEQL